MSKLRPYLIGAAVAAAVAGATAAAAFAPPPMARSAPEVAERSATDLSADLAAGRVTSEALVRAYLARIDALDRNGPQLRSVIALNPHALDDARRADAERKAGRVRGPLHGVPVLIKDNIEGADGTATTAGSLALANNVTGRDAPLVQRLREAGAVILGKTNLSEWANIRSPRSISGWSAVGGLVKNPYALNRNACGSSSGTGAAIAAFLGAVGVGTETDGSITCPSAVNGLVGFKPTVGLVSRTHVIPISASQDTAGPMARSVADAALLLTALAGSDPRDPATREADARKRDYLAALQGAALSGKRIGVLRYAAEVQPAELALFEQALQAMRDAGATLVEIKGYRPPESFGGLEFKVLMTELKAGLNAYLASTDPAKVQTRTLAEVIAFNARTPRELALFGQESFEEAQKTTGLDDPAYRKARADSLRMAGAEGIDRLMADHRLDALTAPTTVPAWVSDIVDGDHVETEGATSLAAVAGYPHATVPMGAVRGLPVGISFIGRAWDDAEVLRLAYAYEQTSKARQAPTYPSSLESAPEVAELLAPPTADRRAP
jgi:amidase